MNEALGFSNTGPGALDKGPNKDSLEWCYPQERPGEELLGLPWRQFRSFALRGSGDAFPRQV